MKSDYTSLYDLHQISVIDQQIFFCIHFGNNFIQKKKIGYRLRLFGDRLHLTQLLLILFEVKIKIL